MIDKKLVIFKLRKRNKKEIKYGGNKYIERDGDIGQIPLWIDYRRNK